MKRASKTSGKLLPPVVLHKEDLASIAESLAQSNGLIEITTNDYEYESIDELVDNVADNLRGLSIKRTSPYISVDLDRWPGVWVYASSDDLVSKGIFSELLSILEPRVRRTYVVVSKIAKVAGWLGALGGGMLFGTGQYREALILLLLLPVEFIFMLVKHRNIINRSRRANKMSFWARNSDQVIVAIIGAFAGAIITIFLMSVISNGQP